MRKSELLDQPLQSLRLLEGVQVLALDVLDQRHRERRLIGDVAHERGHFTQARLLRGAPSPFAGDDLEAAALDGPHENRLHDALLLDRERQLGKRRRIHFRPRLITAPAQPVEG